MGIKSHPGVINPSRPLRVNICTIWSMLYLYNLSVLFYTNPLNDNSYPCLYMGEACPVCL